MNQDFPHLQPPGLDVDDDLFEPSRGPVHGEQLPPVFTATYDCACSEGDYIEAGEQI